MRALSAPPWLRRALVVRAAFKETLHIKGSLPWGQAKRACAPPHLTRPPVPRP